MTDNCNLLVSPRASDVMIHVDSASAKGKPLPMNRAKALDRAANNLYQCSWTMSTEILSSIQKSEIGAFGT